jgi:hypothetical protein
VCKNGLEPQRIFFLQVEIRVKGAEGVRSGFLSTDDEVLKLKLGCIPPEITHLDPLFLLLFEALL